MVSEAFRGEFYQKVDSKARVSIPAAFRRILEAEDPTSGEARPRVYMVYGGKSRNFVECYSRAGADALAVQIAGMALGSPDRDRAERDLISR
jgi:MraZ protein